MNQNPCSQCHGNVTEYCRLSPTSIEAILPSVIQKGSTTVTLPVEISGSGASSYYRIDSLRVTLKTTGGKLTIQNPSQEWTNLYPGGKIFFTTVVSGILEGSDTLVFELSARNTHHSSTFTDTYSYDVQISTNSSSSQNLAVEPSTHSLYFSEKQITTQLLILRDIENLQITTSNNVTVTPSTLTAAKAGEIVTLTIMVLGNTTMQDTLSISWAESAENQQTQVYLTYVIPGSVEINWFSIVGRGIGIISLALLIISICLSGINKTIRSHVNIHFNKKQRTRFHCYVSWALMVIALFHGILLLYGPYAAFVTKPEIILGYLTMISMVIVGLNGAFRIRIINILGAGLWRKTHGYYSYISLLFCLLHACVIGTEFGFIRSLL